MKEIQLTQGQVALVDDEDFERVNQHKWFAKFNKNTNSFYAARDQHIKGEGMTLMHRFIMNTPKNLVCDHINGKTLDNRKNNLRNCTISENSMNKKASITNKLGIRGVSKKGNKFVVRVFVKRKIVFYKYFSSLEEAIKERDKALQKHHGEFANTGE